MKWTLFLILGRYLFFKCGRNWSPLVHEITVQLLSVMTFSHQNYLLACIFIETTFGMTYHSSVSIMNWTQAREWCQSMYTDLAFIQNQKENDYLVSKLPNKNKGPYYWIGITKKHMNETWTWIGNNSTWTGAQSWATNEPNNNHSTEFCVEIYVNNGENRGKWNDEKCANRKHAACYKGTCSWLF